MASEYLKKKYKDVKPDEKRELTPSEKRKNWWDYHKWHVIIGLVLVFIAGDLIWHSLGIGQIKPDYQVAYVGKNRLPDDTVAALEAGLASLGEDLNGDGRVVVKINQYAASNSNSGDGYYYTMAANVTLIADLDDCESYFFLLENPNDFQRSYQVLRNLDGSLPTEETRSAEGTYLNWGDCPILAELDLGGYKYSTAAGDASGDSQELISTIAIARRGFWTNKTCAYSEGCDVLWEMITQRANP